MSAVADPIALDRSVPTAPQANVARRLLRNPAVVTGAAILALMLGIALAAPWLGTVDPAAINPAVRNKLPGYEETVRNADGAESTLVHRLGTDTLGRDVYSRVAYGARASLLVGASVALTQSRSAGDRLLAGYIRWLDGIAAGDGRRWQFRRSCCHRGGLASSTGLLADRRHVIPEIPRVVRLVRSVVLSVREAVRRSRDLGRHATLPLIVATFCPILCRADRAGDLCRSRDPDRGDPLVSRGGPRRRPPGNIRRGPGAVPRLSPQHPLSRSCSR
jgi:peptide/nickel transport system permease protein